MSNTRHAQLADQIAQSIARGADRGQIVEALLPACATEAIGRPELDAFDDVGKVSQVIARRRTEVDRALQPAREVALEALRRPVLREPLGSTLINLPPARLAERLRQA